jgi:hypothetical protein
MTPATSRTAYGSLPATPDTTAYAVGQPRPRVRCARWTPKKTTPPPCESRGKTDTREDDAPLAKIAARRTAVKMTLPPSRNHGKTDERPRRRRRPCTALPASQAAACRPRPRCPWRDLRAARKCRRTTRTMTLSFVGGNSEVSISPMLICVYNLVLWCSNFGWTVMNE